MVSKEPCEPCLNDGNPSTCGGGFPCRTTTKPDGCNRNKCNSFDCEQHPGYACRIGESVLGGRRCRTIWYMGIMSTK